MESSGHMTTNYQYQSKPLVRPDELMKMNMKTAIVMIEGRSPIKLKKNIGLKHETIKDFLDIYLVVEMAGKTLILARIRK